MARKVALLLWAQTLGLAGAQTTQLLVEPPWRPAVLWDQVTLTCQGLGTAGATTWYKDGQHWGHQGLIHVTVTESGNYTCDRPGSGHSRHVEVLDDQLVLQVPMRMLLEGDTVTLRCRYRQDNPVSSVFFYHEEKELVEFQNGTELFLSRLQLHHSGRYRCKGWVNSGVALGWEVSAPVTVTVHVPVANVTITLSPLAHQVRAGDPVTLRCSVQVGSAPVTFTWLHNGQKVARGPLLELGDVDVGHSGTYQCVATNQLGQDGHRALSPKLVLEVTPHSPWLTVSLNVGRTLLFLLLLLAVIGGCLWWHRWAARKLQDRLPCGVGVLDPHVRGTELAGRGTQGSVTHGCPLALPHLVIHK